jgi:broad specificity phosphatase PhoE
MDAPGGESQQAVIGRAGQWLAHRAPGHALAVTHASVIRAIVVHVLDAPAQAAMQLDIAPMTLTMLTTLSSQSGKWRVSAVAVPLSRY